MNNYYIWFWIGMWCFRLVKHKMRFFKITVSILPIEIMSITCFMNLFDNLAQVLSWVHVSIHVALFLVLYLAIPIHSSRPSLNVTLFLPCHLTELGPPLRMEASGRSLFSEWMNVSVCDLPPVHTRETSGVAFLGRSDLVESILCPIPSFWDIYSSSSHIGL